MRSCKRSVFATRNVFESQLIVKLVNHEAFSMPNLETLNLLKKLLI